MAKKPNEKNPFAGNWHIVSMSAWEDDYLNEEVQAFIEFEKQVSGSFQFGYVQGQIDCHTAQRDGKPAVEFSWEGGDGADGTPLTGRGWAILEGDELNGMFLIHEGEESEFVARRPLMSDVSEGLRELVRVLEEAVQAGADSIGMEYEDRDWIVYYNFGNTGLGATRIPEELRQG